MNKTHLDQTDMFNAVVQYMEQHRPIWQGTKVLSDTVAELEETTRSATDKLLRQSGSTSGVSEEMDKLRPELELSVLQMANQLAVLAAKTNDYQLAAECEVSVSRLSALTRDALATTGERVHELITRHLAALADYGITPADAAALEALLDKFRKASAGQVSETTTLPALIRGTSSLLRHQLDKLMTRFRTSHPEFYAGYLRARGISVRGHNVPPAQTAPSTAVEQKA